MVKYCRELENKEKCVKAIGADLRVHYKNTYETAGAIRGKSLDAARQYLEAVLEHKRCVPFRKHTGCIGRTAQAKEFNLTQGRWPEKSVRIILSLLENAASNASVKGLDADKLYISHIAVQQAARGRRRTYRAHGRINAYMSSPCHVEVFLTERQEVTAAPKDKQVIRLSKRQLAVRRLRNGGGLSA